MSRISRLPLEVQDLVTCSLQENLFSMKGPKGTLFLKIPEGINVKIEDKKVLVQAYPHFEDSPQSSALCGTIFRLLSNMQKGVSDGFSITLNLVGVGYKAELKGKELHLSLGFSHPVIFPVPEDIEIKVEKPVQIKVLGMDKQRVGQIAAEIRAYRPPEPYKGKGVHREGDYLRRKEGKNK
jgi:large subunit ribosomal protein L6